MMENAVNIMAMVQGKGIVKKKSDVPSKPLGNDITSFRKELHQARKDISKYNSNEPKDVGEMNQSTTEKKIEKLAKVMSNSNVKAEIKKEVKVEANADIKDESSVDAAKQTDTIETKPNSDVADKKQLELTEEDVESLKSVQAALDTVQQMIQMMQGQKAEGASKEQLTELKTELQTVIQKLQELVETPIASGAHNLDKHLNGLKDDLTKLVAQLEIIPENEINLKQMEQLFNQLSNKLNWTENLNNRMHQEIVKPQNSSEAMQLPLTPALKLENKEAEITDRNKAVQAVDEMQQTQKMDNEKPSDDKGNEEDETSYKASENNSIKQAAAGEKLNQTNVNEIVAPQVEKENFQLNIKQASANLQKGNLVKLSTSDIINQVVKKADILVQGSHQEMVMKLEPESLGKINLKIIVENGLVTAKFIAESQQVKEVLESSFNQLKDALQQKGVSVQGFSVSVGQQGAEFNSGRGFDKWKETIKTSSKISGGYMGLDDENNISMNPYNYHEGKVDYRA